MSTNCIIMLHVLDRSHLDDCREGESLGALVRGGDGAVVAGGDIGVGGLLIN